MPSLPRTRESTWQVVRRCLAMVRRLQQGPATRKELLEAVYLAEGEEAYGGTTGQARQKRFEGDKERLAKYLGFRIGYDRHAGGYVLKQFEQPLLDLPDPDLETLAFLADTFRPESPQVDMVQRLVGRLVEWMPASRQHTFQRMRGLQPNVDLRQRDSEEIAPDVWQAVLEAHQARQLLEFDYLSSQHEDGIPRQHIVEPWDFDFSDRGHWRLRAFCRFNDGPNGPWEPRDYINYRLSRIVAGSARVLPEKLSPIRPSGRPKEVLFRLSPAIARFGVSHRQEFIKPPQVTRLPDGWVQVRGRTHDLFDLARNLLYYGEQCVVEGGPELWREMQGLVQGLAAVYAQER